ncbi:replication-relaxation family protein [Aureispira sp. CCB-QB1]|uniref:replication-relaxation family protein n=1 Tax=Aureispira sp. CCB-QB1 TaxID=1313421 RepID=UPI000695D1A6|nr:replication-relaxation family protein [Aureispira sp. CCB-QB1]
MQKFNATHSSIIEKLAKFKFLTYSQMVKLGVSKSKAYIGRNMQLLLTKKYVGRLDFGVHPSKGKLESFFYLLPKSKALLVDEWDWEESKIRMPIGRSSFFSKDYEHRKGVIDYHIRIYQETQSKNQSIVFFDTYFDKVGAAKQKNLKALTNIHYGEGDYLIADAIFMVKDGEELDLYALEYHRGTDTKRMLRTIEEYGRVLADGSLSIKHGLRKNAKVVCLFENESCLEATKSRFMQDRRFEVLREWFIFVMCQK